jgi:hypothetical protein
MPGAAGVTIPTMFGGWPHIIGMSPLSTSGQLPDRFRKAPSVDFRWSVLVLRQPIRQPVVLVALELPDVSQLSERS